jgi:DNA-binding transcriptional ArsR family regulator
MITRKPPAMALDDAARLLRLLGNRARLGIVLRVGAGRVTVAALEAELGIRQPNLSQHLAELRDAGLLASQREGRTVFYTLANAHAEAIVECLAKAIGHQAPAARAAPEASRPRFVSGSAVFAAVKRAD